MIKIAEPIIKDEEIEAVVDVLRSGQIARGRKVVDFEDGFSKLFGRGYESIATSSGTAALHAALRGCGIEKNDSVIVPAFSFFSTASMVIASDAYPIFVDVTEDGTIDIERAEDAITEDTKAIIGVNLYGKRIPDIITLEKICLDYGLCLIIDSCQSPATFGGVYGDVSCFSFYATKNITTGEGGMVVTHDEHLYKNIESFIDHGQEGKYNHTHIGYNYRMTDIAAAIGVVQLTRLESINKRRREIARLYDSKLRCNRPDIVDDHVFHQYVITHPQRRFLKEFLHDRGIETAIHYPKIIPHQPIFKKYYKDECFPVAKRLSEMVLSLPCHPNLTDEDVEFVCESVNDFCIRSKS